MMSMSFHIGVSESAILFSQWSTANWQGILGSAIGIILLGAIHEGLKNYREHLFIKASIFKQHGRGKKTQRATMMSGIHLLQTVLQMIQVVLSYFLMFIFMTYNVWLALAVVIGTGLGYWLFAWEKMSHENTDCCNI